MMNDYKDNKTLTYKNVIKQTIEDIGPISVDTFLPDRHITLHESKHTFTALGEIYHIDNNLTITYSEKNSNIDLMEYILILHYLKNKYIPKKNDSFISYREMPGGAFYYKPFKARSTDMLVSVIQNDIDRLKSNLSQFDYTFEKNNDLTVVIRPLGVLEMLLVYNMSDEEFPAEAELFFDSSIKQIYSTDNVAALAHVVCKKLMVS